MRSRIIFILTFALSLYSNVLSYGQSISESNGPPQPNPENKPAGPAGLPIDDQILIILGLGLALGIYFLIKKYRATDIPA